VHLVPQREDAFLSLFFLFPDLALTYNVRVAFSFLPSPLPSRAAAVASDSKRRVQFSRVLPSPISDNLAFDVNGGELSSRERHAARRYFRS